MFFLIEIEDVFILLYENTQDAGPNNFIESQINSTVSSLINQLNVCKLFSKHFHKRTLFINFVSVKSLYMFF